MTPHGNTADDNILYTDEAIRVGLILFPPRKCSHCGAVLPSNSDYFTPDYVNANGLTSNCRRCRRLAARESYRRKKAKA